MSSSSLLELEDEGMSMLLSLKELIDGLMKYYSNSLETAEEGTVSVTYEQPNLINRTTRSIDPQANASTYRLAQNGVLIVTMAPWHTHPPVSAVILIHLLTHQ